jgi:membrane-bound lytic murein transglycosylase D
MVVVTLCTSVLAGCNSSLIKRQDPPAEPVAAVPIETRGQPDFSATAERRSPRRVAAKAPPKLAPVAAGDTWERLRLQFRLETADNADVRRELQWYREHPRYLREVSTRARPYLHFIANELEQRKLPGELALLPILESGFRTDVASPYGAAGLWQFMGGTGSKFGLDINRNYDGRMDVTRSTGAALNYLDALRERFDGDWLMAIAAYNAGWGNLEKALANQRRLGRSTDFWALPVTRETRLLVARMIALATVFKAPERYGLNLAPLPDRPYFETVELAQPTDLNRFRAALGVPADEFAQLNAAWRTGNTGHGPARVHVPLGHVDAARKLAASGAARAAPPTRVAAAMDREPRESRQGKRVTTHQVRNGDSLWTIARRYDLTVAQLAAANGLTARSTLRIGQQLRIPTAAVTARQVAEQAQRTVRYRVQSGDSLWTISRQFKVSVQELVAWNGLQRKRQLQPGQELLVHRPS